MGPARNRTIDAGAVGPEPALATPPPASGSSRAAESPSGRRIESWETARLKDHERQAALFRDLEGTDFEDLVASIRREGIRDPIQVTPDGVIIDGHQRVRAARQLDLSEVPVWVRDDLAGDPGAIDRAHLLANRDRRQLDSLDRVRVARRLEELELGRGPGRLDDGELGQLSGRVSERLGISVRHARRLLNITALPMSIQAAFSAQRIKLVDADRVSRLDGRIRRRIDEEIRAGGDPREIVGGYLRRPAPRVGPGIAYARLLAELVRGLDALEGREGEIRPEASRLRADLDAFGRLERLCATVVPELERRLQADDIAAEEYSTSLAVGGIADDLGLSLD